MFLFSGRPWVGPLSWVGRGSVGRGRPVRNPSLPCGVRGPLPIYNGVINWPTVFVYVMTLLRSVAELISLT